MDSREQREARQRFARALDELVNCYTASDGNSKGSLALGVGCKAPNLSKYIHGTALPPASFLRNLGEFLTSAGIQLSDAEFTELGELHHRAHMIASPSQHQAAYLVDCLRVVEGQVDELRSRLNRDKGRMVAPLERESVMLRMRELDREVRILQDDLTLARSRLRGMSGRREVDLAGVKLPVLQRMNLRSRRTDAALEEAELEARKIERSLRQLEQEGATEHEKRTELTIGDPAALTWHLDNADVPAQLSQALRTLRERAGGAEAWPVLRMAETAYPELRTIKEALEDTLERALDATALLADEHRLKALVTAMGASDSETLAFTAAYVRIRQSRPPIPLMPARRTRKWLRLPRWL